MVIGQQCLPYRGAGNEAVYAWSDAMDNDNSGNFIALMKLIAEFDPLTRQHIDRAVQASTERHAHTSSRGRGSLVTFLSKTTLNKLIVIIGDEVLSKIASCVKKAKKFAVMVDSTQCVGVTEQGAIVLRYCLASGPVERFVGVVEFSSTRGEAMFNDTKKHIEERLGLRMENAIAASLDGAMANRSEERGFIKYHRDIVPGVIFIWCYAHVMNLVVTDFANHIPVIKRVNGLLERTACFMSESHKRMKIWHNSLRDRAGTQRMQRLVKLNHTRWWTRALAVQRITGELPKIANSQLPPFSTHQLFTPMLEALQGIRDGPFEATACETADSLIQAWTKFENVRTLILLQHVYGILHFTTVYLQKSDLDILAAFRLIESARGEIVLLNFDVLHRKAVIFSEEAQKQLDLFAMEEGIDERQRIFIQNSLPTQRIAGKKRMFDEIANDDRRNMDVLQLYRVEVYRCAIDRILRAIDERYLNHKALAEGMSVLDPRNYPGIAAHGAAKEKLLRVAEIANVDATRLQMELECFAKAYPSLCADTTGAEEQVSFNFHVSPF
jgi:hypothetical protein